MKESSGLKGKEPEKPRRNSFRRFLNLLGAIILLALIPFAYRASQKFYTRWLEQNDPQISIPETPKGLGTKPLNLIVRVDDGESGVDEVNIRAEQDGEIRRLKRDFYREASQKKVSITLPLDAKKLGFREGPLRLIVSAFDRSFWGNGQRKTLDMIVDYKRPAIEVVTAQHNAVHGGAEFIFYFLKEEHHDFSGVKVGEELIPGFQALNLDADFKSVPNIYFTFFPVPLSFSQKSDKIRLHARDMAGNSSDGKMYYRVRKKRFGKKKIELEEDFLREKVAELLPKYYQLEAKFSGEKAKEYVSAGSDKELVDQFRLISASYSSLIAELLRPLVSQSKKQRLWREHFAIPAGSPDRRSFGRVLSFSYHGSDLGSIVHRGVDLAVKPMAEVRAANNGVVIFRGELGPYGKTVIIDHGFGLTTLYAHLSDSSIAAGAAVKRGQPFARAGRTGLALSKKDRLHFEVRLHGIPVNPVEWWDKHWVADHIEQKIAEAKKRLALGLGVSPG